MTLGLDLGIASVGWCLFDSDENDNPRRIIDLGSFVYDQLENGKTGKRENQERRQKRGMRRQRRRRVRRLYDCRKLLKDGLNVDFCVENNQCTVNGIPVKNFPSPFELKIKGLKEKLSPEELSIALYHYVKYRGFKSNRKSVDQNNKAEKGLLMKIREFTEEREKLGEDGYITDVIWNRYQNGLKSDRGTSIHNHGTEYNLTIARAEYEREIDALLSRQVSFGVTTEDFKQSFLELFRRQRNYSDGPDPSSPYKVDFSKARGICIFDQNPYAIKDSYSATAFTLLSRLCNFRFRMSSDESYRSLSANQIQKAFLCLLSAKETKYSKLLKSCGFSDSEIKQIDSIKGLSLTKSDRKAIVTDLLKKSGKTQLDVDDWPKYEEMEQKRLLEKTFFRNSDFFNKIYNEYHSEKKNANQRFSEEIQKKLNYIAFVFFKYKTDSQIEKALRNPESEPEGKGLSFTDEEIDRLMNLPYDATKTIELSKEICNQLIPLMLEGKRYDEAMKEIGYDHYNGLVRKTGKIQMLPDIDTALANMDIKLNNPVVKHTLVQMRKIINAIIKTYGYPTSYSIELARELKKSYDERKKIENQQQENRENNSRLKLEMMEQFPNVIRSFKDAERKDNLIRYRLFKEQNGISPYTGVPIDMARIFDDNYYQVDHIIPYSVSFDDSFSNKVLVETKENQEKKNKTPREHYQGRFSFIEDFAMHKCHDKKKRENLLFKGNPRTREDFSNSAAPDTSYIATLAVKLINTYLLDDESHCQTVSGAITAKLRNLWEVSGRVHSYLSVYDKKLYRLRSITNYRYYDLKVGESKKSITFVFNYRNDTSSLINLNQKEEITIEGKSGDRIPEEEKRFNGYLTKVLENLDTYRTRFRNYIDNDVFSLQEATNFLSEDSQDSISYDDAMSAILGRVIKELSDKCNEKNRENDLHHALDAAVIGCATPSIIKKVSDFFQYEECEIDYLTSEQRLELKLPYLDFNKEVLLRVYERDEKKLIDELNRLPMYQGNPATFENVHVMWPVRQQKTHVVGAISKDTTFGIVEVNGKKMLTKTLNIDKIDKKNIQNIVNINGGNNAVISAIQDWMKLDKKERPAYPILPKKNTPIRSVTVFESELSNQPWLGKNKYADNSEVVRVDIYKRNVSGDESLYFVPIYYYQIFNERRKNKKKDTYYTIFKGRGQNDTEVLTLSDLKNEFTKLLSLNRCSLIEIETETGKGFAYSAGATSGKFEIKSILGDNYDLYHDGLINDPNKSQYQITVSTIKSIKLHNISVLGKIS